MQKVRFSVGSELVHSVPIARQQTNAPVEREEPGELRVSAGLLPPLPRQGGLRCNLCFSPLVYTKAGRRVLRSSAARTWVKSLCCVIGAG